MKHLEHLVWDYSHKKQASTNNPIYFTHFQIIITNRAIEFLFVNITFVTKSKTLLIL